MLSFRKAAYLAFLAVSFALASGCVERSRSAIAPINHNDRSSVAASAAQNPANESSDRVIEKRININTASVQQLETLPGIGEAFGERIIKHREKYGAFRKPEHLIIVRGISDKRFQNLRDLIMVE